ncbi:MAG: ABC transporter ATP-binding protein [Gemmataceae bacterium]
MLVRVESRVEESVRVAQVRGLFDLPEERYARRQWEADLPLDARPWSIGLVAGASGSGKSTVARALFPPPGCLWPEALPAWDGRRAVVDGFPAALEVRDVAALLGAVGLSSPPAWLLPYQSLSTGQRFRADLARLLGSAAPGQVCVFDEYTSVVDRTVARVASAAVAKAVRKRGLRFVAVTCHDDVLEWLQPDWVYRPGDGSFARRSVQPRPRVDLRVFRTVAKAWRLFRDHHYLSHSLSQGAVCFGCEVRLNPDEPWRPAGFSAWVNHLTALGGKREHRTVVLPDFQGIGLGMALSAYCASVWTGLGFRAVSTTTHPAFRAARARSADWEMTRAPALAAGRGATARGHAATRLTSGWRYVGPALDAGAAKLLLGV